MKIYVTVSHITDTHAHTISHACLHAVASPAVPAVPPGQIAVPKAPFRLTHPAVARCPLPPQVLPFDTALRVWDCLFGSSGDAEGPCVLISVALAVLTTHRRELLKVPRPPAACSPPRAKPVACVKRRELSASQPSACPFPACACDMVLCTHPCRCGRPSTSWGRSSSGECLC